MRNTFLACQTKHGKTEHKMIQKIKIPTLERIEVLKLLSRVLVGLRISSENASLIPSFGDEASEKSSSLNSLSLANKSLASNTFAMNVPSSRERDDKLSEGSTLNSCVRLFSMLKRTDFFTFSCRQREIKVYGDYQGKIDLHDLLGG